MHRYVFRKSSESNQIISTDSLLENIIEPFIDFNELLNLFYVNSYHRRAILIKSHLLSQIEETNLDKFLPQKTNPKDFLFAFALNLEIYGNAFLEMSGTPNNFSLYILPTIEARIDKDGNIYQKTSQNDIKRLEGYHLKYYSPASRFYGEPDYMSVFAQIQIESKINQYNNAFFDNSAKPDLAIIFEGAEPTDEQIAAFREFFESNYKGYINSHRTLIISAPADMGSSTQPRIRIEKLSNINDMSFENLKKINRDEIIAAHGVPPRLVGVLAPGQLGGSNELISQLHAFNETTLKPKIKLIEYFFNNMVGVDLKLKQLDTTDFKDDADVINGLVQTGVITIQEAREILGWQKKEID